MSSTHTQGCFPYEASDTPNHLEHRTHTINCVNKYILDTNAQKNSHPAIWQGNCLSKCNENKVADFPPLHLCLVLNCPTFHSSLPQPSHFPKPPGWPWAHSMSGLGRKSYLADVRHLISYRGKLLCKINTRPSLTSTQTRLEFFCVLQWRKQNSCNRLTTASSKSAGRVSKQLEDCPIAWRLHVNYRGTKQCTFKRLNIPE